MRTFNIVITAMLAAGVSWFSALRPPEADLPELLKEGPEARVKVAVSPLRLEVSGGEVERIDEHCLRLKTRGGNLAVALLPGEAIYGLTERIVDDHEASENRPQAVGGLDRRGELVSMWVTPTIAGYVPFYISSAGYGMLVEGTRPGIYDIGKSEPEVLRLGWDVGPEGLSCVFIEGPGCLQILERYTRLTGRPFLPPRWVFLPWKWRDEVKRGKFADLDGLPVNAEVAEDILNYEKLGFPAGVYLIDRPWAEGTMGFGNFNWDEKRFPNGDAMVQKLAARGWRVVIWGAPWALGKKDFEFGPEARAKGLVIGGRNLDYTNPAARAWHREKIMAFLKRSGVSGWKLDRGDEYNPSRKTDIYHDGRTGFVVHNEYPRLYIQTYYEATRAVRGDDFVLMARPAYSGTQAFSVKWGGDTRGCVHYPPGFARPTDKGLRSVIISLQRMAMLGFPVWGSDTGGYQGFRDRDTFARWLQVSAFCPLMEIGGVGPHEPWAMPTRPAFDPEMIKIFKRYTWLHARLADYTYALAERAHQTGDPIVHPLVFDWPEDPKVKDLWDEYMYGPAFLVAPVWQRGKRDREVYLPRGKWIDLWDRSRTYEGPLTIQVQAPLDRIPVFIRAGEENLVPEGLLEGL